ncbi:hypothetical protein [Arthrobacter agilis]|nr:hypothetical protein [Arthrobacter agilis]MDQ0734758.1 hypothetical protein [Arthrobacter agilis]
MTGLTQVLLTGASWVISLAGMNTSYPGVPRHHRDFLPLPPAL